MLRVGSGGVMLPHYSPLKVAENFSALSGLYPGRIDLGLGRAPGADGMTMYALQRDRREPAPDDFPQQLAELLGYLNGNLPASFPFARLATTLPGLPERPDVWLLGSSPQSAIWAGELSLPYSFADFINPNGPELGKLYRERFLDTPEAVAPQLSVAVWTICAETDEEAQRLASSARMTFRLLREGTLIPVPPVEKALRFLESRGGVEASGIARDRRGIIGSPEKVRAGLEEVAREYGAEEMMIVTITHDHAARRRSYELIAEAFAEPSIVTDQPASATSS
jgi:luciferase family oxidoreductase group 1